MKKRFLFLLFITSSFVLHAQHKPFRFAFISDTHIGSPNGGSEEDLRRTVRDINAMKDIAFVVLTGDITELGKNEELVLAKQLLDSLNIKWYIIPGNHDTGWSESGGLMFSKVFGYDKFSFEYNGIRFLGCPSGPYLRMSDGHVPRESVNWLDAELKKLKPGQPVIFLNHYPIDIQLDNWYEVTDRLHRYNTWAILCGHGHANKALNFEDIPGVMGRSNLRAKAPIGGYNIVDVRKDSIIFSERKPGTETLKAWTAVKIENHHYDTKKTYKRPDFSANRNYPNVKEKWRYTSAANIISTPAVKDGLVVVGNQQGKLVCLDLATGKLKWSFQTKGPIFSSPAISGGRVVFGSADNTVNCLDLKTGAWKWTLTVNGPVLGSPLIYDNAVYIGSSDHCFRKLSLQNGMIQWWFCDMTGPVVSTPLLYEGKLIYGAWDRYLYALDTATGQLKWKWTNGSSVINYSPASCIPVAHDGVVYVVAPDRYISAIDANTGETLWRNNDATVRESIGISADGKYVYGKTMQDTVVAYASSRTKQNAAWKMHAGFGYEHVPSMLIEKKGNLYFGTRSGVVYSINPDEKKLNWTYKIDNSMVNTVTFATDKKLIASTMDGKVVLLEMSTQ
jgi:outer membrane protein assembly factor BamB/predicted phosphodiesterase